MVPQRPGIAFVEYEDEGQAGVAMQGLQGFKLATGEAPCAPRQPRNACLRKFPTYRHMQRLLGRVLPRAELALGAAQAHRLCFEPPDADKPMAISYANKS